MNLAVLGEQNLEKFGEYTQLIFEDRHFTNAELYSTAARFASALVEAGLKPGDRVGVMLPNVPEVGMSYSAILRAGAIAVPMVFLLAIPEVQHILADSEARFVITSPEFEPNISKACESLPNPPTIVVAGEGVSQESASRGSLLWSEMLASARDPLPIVERSDDDLAVVMYTSGTTGRPKGVMLSHGNMLFNSRASAQALDLREGDVTVGGLPMAHLFGLAGTVTGSLFKVSGVLLRWFTAEGFFDAVTRHGASSSAAVPTMLAYMLAHPQFDEVDWSKFRWIIVAAAPVPVEMAEEFEERTGARVLEAYGMTETSPTVSIMRSDESSRAGSCGRPVPGIEVCIMDDNDAPVAAGETGELCVKGPNVMRGYYNLPEKTSEVLRDGWLHTGDIARQDSDGYLYITERKKDLIIRAGFNIFPRDVEEVLYGHPAVLEAAVVGLPDRTLGEEVVAYVVLRPGETATEDELIALCRDALAKYKTPRFLRFVTELPKNPIGKILKRDLREMAKKDFR